MLPDENSTCQNKYEIDDERMLQIDYLPMGFWTWHELKHHITCLLFKILRENMMESLKINS